MKKRRGQTIVEYFILMSMMVGILLATDLLGRVRIACEIYFNKAVTQMLR